VSPYVRMVRTASGATAVTVYVDDFRIQATVGPYKAHWSHLFTDSPNIEELHTFAASIGLRRSWFQDKQSGAHYDVTDKYRQRAITAGAKAVHWRDVRTVWPPREHHDYARKKARSSYVRRYSVTREPAATGDEENEGRDND
jgi:Protein of unknown function (DUF4031)